ncbi:MULTISPECIES: hypothetical protein [unclassified Mesorhizobium]|uniref:hypothetical protein n=1 Tax=unclassified Mesorhizobium TaxID=325217 RepID=UPI00112DAE5A|nr:MULTISPECIES: hypothetical protein [unclassified Mesorhizobium]MCA0027373.1 hypothetical protein [Mesorhizobium sp. B263B1A]TPJ98646.1 hypothetical protein FJ489_06880 [Mesorhizobium sp. B2-5-12]TPK28809.1 hypothetical protein FJ562_00270 [Mesorhizobium sp. B2-5-6]
MLDHGGYRSSAQTRPILPEGGMPEDGGEVHPRCREMAEAMRDLLASGGGVRFADLIRADFTSAEIVEFKEAAAKLATELSTRQVSIRPDLLADVIDKARQAMPNRLPLPRDTSQTQALTIAWGRYCAARGALLVDPWPGQRERCIAVLSAYLDRLPIFPTIRRAVVAAVEETLPRVTQ